MIEAFRRRGSLSMGVEGPVKKILVDWKRPGALRICHSCYGPSGTLVRSCSRETG